MGKQQSSNGTLSPKIEPKYKNQFNVEDGKIIEVKNIVVHRFNVADVEDPELYAAEPILEWQNSEQGQWVMKHAVETPVWQRTVDYSLYSYSYCIIAKLTTKDLTYFYLKWGQCP